MTHTRYAFIKAQWHADIVDRALDGFQELIPADQINVFDVPGAFEMPLLAQELAKTGQYAAVACAAFVVDGGIYRHDFVAQAVVDGLMRAGMDTGVPVLSVSLTPHQYQETDHHNAIYRAHFVEKGREAAALIAAGAIDGLSIGYRTLKATKNDKGQRLLTELELWEVSLVTFPMLPSARVASKAETPDDDAWSDLAHVLEGARRNLAGG
jgi:6,7-dimethyl-8-ribityllumazine synthase